VLNNTPEMERQGVLSLNDRTPFLLSSPWKTGIQYTEGQDVKREAQKDFILRPFNTFRAGIDRRIQGLVLPIKLNYLGLTPSPRFSASLSSPAALAIL